MSLLHFLSRFFFRIQFPVFLSPPQSAVLNHFSFPWIKSWKPYENFVDTSFSCSFSFWIAFRENFEKQKLVISLPPPQHWWLPSEISFLLIASNANLSRTGREDPFSPNRYRKSIQIQLKMQIKNQEYKFRIWIENTNTRILYIAGKREVFKREPL